MKTIKKKKLQIRQIWWDGRSVLLRQISLPYTDAKIYISDCDEDQEYFDKVLKAAHKLGKASQFHQQLAYLAQYACWRRDAEGNEVPGNWDRTLCILGRDFAPLSFGFAMLARVPFDDENSRTYKYWFNGGLVFHGQHDGFGSGSAPTYSVSLNKADGWQVHT